MSASPLERCHWVFDLDGTLTVAVHDFDRLREELGLPGRAPILEALAAMPVEERAPLEDKLVAWERRLAVAARMAPDAAPLLEHLAHHGKRMGVLTRNTRAHALLTLDAAGIAAVFDPEDVIGRDGAQPKPSPEGIALLARRWRAPTSDVVMVGDYLFDLQAGRAAGVCTVLVDRARTGRWRDQADLVVGGLDELLEE